MGEKSKDKIKDKKDDGKAHPAPPPCQVYVYYPCIPHCQPAYCQPLFYQNIMCPPQQLMGQFLQFNSPAQDCGCGCKGEKKKDEKKEDDKKKGDKKKDDKKDEKKKRSNLYGTLWNPRLRTRSPWEG